MPGFIHCDNLGIQAFKAVGCAGHINRAARAVRHLRLDIRAGRVARLHGRGVGTEYQGLFNTGDRNACGRSLDNAAQLCRN